MSTPHKSANRKAAVEFITFANQLQSFIANENGNIKKRKSCDASFTTEKRPKHSNSEVGASDEEHEVLNKYDLASDEPAPELVKSDSESDDDSTNACLVAINPVDSGANLMAIILGEVAVDTFLNEYYGLKPMHSVGGQERQTFDPFFSLQMLDELITASHLFFGKDVEIISPPEDTSPPPSGRAYRSLVWDQFVIGRSFRVLLPERYYCTFAVRLGFLQEIINGPLYSVVVFANKLFTGALVDPASFAVPLHGDIFVFLLQGSLDINTFLFDDEVKFSLQAGDVLYLPHQLSHNAEISNEEVFDYTAPPAIALCIVNCAPAIVQQYEKRLFDALDLKSVKEGAEQYTLFRDLLIPARDNVSDAFDILYLDLMSERSEECVFRILENGGERTEERRKEEQQLVIRTLNEMRMDFVRKSTAVKLHHSEGAGHISNYGTTWVDPKFQEMDHNFDEANLRAELLSTFHAGRIKLTRELEPESVIRLTRRSSMSIVIETSDTHLEIHHNLCNSHDIRDINEPCCWKMPLKHLPLVLKLIDVYPDCLTICALPGGKVNDQMQVAVEMFDAGLVIAPKFSCDSADESDDGQLKMEENVENEELEEEDDVDCECLKRSSIDAWK